MMTQNEGQRKGTTNQVQKDDEGNEVLFSPEEWFFRKGICWR